MQPRQPVALLQVPRLPLLLETAAVAGSVGFAADAWRQDLAARWLFWGGFLVTARAGGARPRVFIFLWPQ